MTRRSCLRRGGLAALSLLGLVASGCELGKSSLRKETKPESLPPYDLDAIRSGESLELPSDDPKSFFKKMQGGGTWSSEAREVERSLGVDP